LATILPVIQDRFLDLTTPATLSIAGKTPQLWSGRNWRLATKGWISSAHRIWCVAFK